MQVSNQAMQRSCDKIRLRGSQGCKWLIAGSRMIGAGRWLWKNRNFVEAALPVGLTIASATEEQFGVCTGLG